MAPVQSRLVLAVTIPAAALAFFLSLFWLRRSSKGHPPSPPDIPDKDSKEKHKVADQGDGTGSGAVIANDFKDSAVNFIGESVDTVAKQEGDIDIVFAGSPISLKSNLSNSRIQLTEDINKENIIYPSCVQFTSQNSAGSKTEDKISSCAELIYACGDKSVGIVKDTKDEKFRTLDTTPIKNEVVETNNICDIKFSAENEIKGIDNKTLEVVCKNNLAPTEKKSPSKTEVEKEPNITKMIKEESASTLKLDYAKETDVEKSDLAEKLANLELDTMKLGDVDVKERDSANHSPSENMLASPSMSNFSDAHSEGSSDSGKGHSDGTTSPSRTPAGGSSVSGDPSPSIYEFVIPQIIVGRLIGRHGVFLHEIMSATHTNIFIKVHPETVKLKICAIEGSQQDIDKALEMIRKKFPIRRYPKLTLERVSFVQLQQSQQLRSEDFHLQLIEGVNNDVILSSLLSPGQFFVQQPCHPSYPCLTPLTQNLTQTYSTTDAPALVNPVPDAICVCPSLGGWYRAQIVSVDEDARHCDIKFVDYGGYLRVEPALLKQIRADFLMLPFQAVECSLANVQPIHEAGWSEEARLFVHNITFGRILQAQVVSYTETGMPLVNLFTSINSQVVMVNAELVSNGFAMLVTADVEEAAEVVTDQDTV